QDIVFDNTLHCESKQTRPPVDVIEDSAPMTLVPNSSDHVNLSSTYTYVGVGVIGVLCSMSLFLSVLRHQRLRKSSQATPIDDENNTPQAAFTISQVDICCSSDESVTLSPEDEECIKELPCMVIPPTNVKITKSLAQGANGQVFLGSYLGRDVAIKAMLPGQHSPTEIQTMVHEISILSRLDHPSIVQFLGVYFPYKHELMFLVEYMADGDLRDRLMHTTPQSNTWSEKLSIATQVAAGLVYIHDKNLIHRDLKSRNILLHDGVAKISDFGAARQATTTHTMTRGIGTYRWMAPEVLSENQYSVAADIFSFGILLTELDTHMIPYIDVKNKRSGAPLVDTAIVSMVIAGAIQPTIRRDCPMWIQQLIMQCIATDPRLRPTAHEIYQQCLAHSSVA
ncbi:kinase, partial [Thraustotheca clavata]